MKLIFGFDLGSTSIGWAVVQEKENDTETSRILKLGVRVNPLTTDEKTDFEKGKPITTNANRRLAHGMRLNLSRYKQRRKELIKNLIRFKFISPDTVLCEYNLQNEAFRLSITNRIISSFEIWYFSQFFPIDDLVRDDLLCKLSALIQNSAKS